MKILAIDTSTKFLSLAVADEEKILAKLHEHSKMKHSALLMPAVETLLEKCGLKIKDMDAIALSIGPGSFTGLRIGVAACKAMNLALGIPIVALPTLDVIAYNFIDRKERVLCPVIDAKKNKIYTCLYNAKEGKLHRLTDYMLTDMNKIIAKIKSPALFFGDALMLYGEECRNNKYIRISREDWFPKAEVAARLGIVKAKKKKIENAEKLVPMYMHSQYCQVRGYKA